MPLAFLDTGIFVAFLNRRDQHHLAAVTLFNTMKPRWSTSLLVVSESYSWFLHRMGEEAARDFSALLGTLEGLELFDISLGHHEKILAMLNRFRGTKLSYVDASSLCFMDRYHIKQAWSTDHHLAMTGAEVLPRS